MNVFVLAAAATLAGAAGQSAQAAPQARPTIILVHGAFAESASWNAVIARLNRRGYDTIAAANPLRSVKGDAAEVATIIRSIPGPVVLVGHSYGGPVITEAANGQANVKALVYVAGFAPEAGESSLSLSGKFPGSTLGSALQPVALPGGGRNLYIRPDTFRAQFAADVPGGQAALMAATQRPVAEAALTEPSGVPSWKALPSYMIYGTGDRNIPPAVMDFMAQRARSVKTVVVKGASHALMISRPPPAEVAALIELAASPR
ncbi:alpha/beta fold hydrolase [Bosea sp. BIWAKO-01]|uniref:alpha/beta fold hydrolase n=1 Tax=Bosea sp. BIWAKO-01 TaxID=506668 RepID=UPI0008535B69|nr:alpha/beta hydrolase [Bosea sp. BIWAKO-01]GAU85842.1 signal peptide protein [Bosea sp. BIWAKO-01]